MSPNSIQCLVASCLVSAHFAQLVATLTGAAIGIITLYRMWKHRTMRADVHLYDAITKDTHDHTH
jgi:membrane associated rhomboid family serine protease